MASGETISTKVVATSFKSSVDSVSDSLNNLSNAGVSNFSYMNGPLSANKMVEVAASSDQDVLNFMKNYVQDTNSFMQSVSDFEKLDEEISINASNI